MYLLAKTQSFVLCEQHILQTLMTVILNPEKPESFKDCQKLSVVVFLQQTMKNCLHNMASYVTLCHQNVFLEVAYCSLKNHFLSNKNKTHTHTNLCNPAVSLCSGFQPFEHRKKYTKGSRMPSHFLKRIPYRHFSQTFSHRTSI